jgi:Lar family restriction alleviation protein
MNDLATEIKLLPCPFCGSTVGLNWERKQERSGAPEWSIHCWTCKVTMTGAVTEQMIKRNWNRRVSDE